MQAARPPLSGARVDFDRMAQRPASANQAGTHSPPRDLCRRQVPPARAPPPANPWTRWTTPPAR